MVGPVKCSCRKLSKGRPLKKPQGPDVCASSFGALTSKPEQTDSIAGALPMAPFAHSDSNFPQWQWVSTCWDEHRFPMRKGRILRKAAGLRVGGAASVHENLKWW